jgi:TM2 domain-containing membrane protein YozV
MILGSMNADDRDNWNAVLRQETEQSEKSWTTALLLSIFLGLFGADRLYLGHPLLGTLKFCSCGLGWLWWVLDVGLLWFGVMKDAQGKIVKRRS